MELKYFKCLELEVMFNIQFCRDVNEYSNVRIFAFHTNIRMRFLDSNIRIIF